MNNCNRNVFIHGKQKVSVYVCIPAFHSYIEYVAIVIVDGKCKRIIVNRLLAYIYKSKFSTRYTRFAFSFMNLSLNIFTSRITARNETNMFENKKKSTHMLASNIGRKREKRHHFSLYKESHDLNSIYLYSIRLFVLARLHIHTLNIDRLS